LDDDGNASVFTAVPHATTGHENKVGVMSYRFRTWWRSAGKIKRGASITGAALGAFLILGAVVGQNQPPQSTKAIAGSGAATTATSSARAITSSSSASPTTTTAALTNGRLLVVTQVVDGDTVHVNDLDGGDLTVRVLGIDTPEIKDPRKSVGCFGPEASAWATSLLTGKQVTVRTDPTQDTRDKYGRLLGYLTLPDGTD
jgi:hypothetical protein